MFLVHHNLIPEVLKYDHVPDHIQQLIRTLYSDHHHRLFSNTFHQSWPWRPPGGLPQPSNIQPLFQHLYSIYFRSKFRQFGFTISSLSPVHWFQFADDTAVITGLENENQILLNHFTRWRTWANMIIRVDKCSTFGIKKSSTSSTQYPPKLIVNQQLVPPIETGKSFIYLGRYCNYAMDNQNHMSEVHDLLNDLMQKIDSLSCHPKNKLLIYHRFVLSKLS